MTAAGTSEHLSQRARRTSIKVRQYRPEDHATVTKIFVEGLMAFDDNPDFRYLWEERLRKDLTNDFADIEGSHMASGGNFWVATATQDESTKIVGIIGLQRRSESEGEVRRLFVDSNCQRMGKKQALEFYAALGYTKGDELMRFWENPQFFEVDKIMKQL
ncbi:hypothetical protein PC113_g20311 [Phytophthora cactorum]|uniref:N-acetyltransferase domain-containing protein n=1 Tax=Phytophthora cactorum TaxID=29920 RepID=A0A8T1BA40_9STRA|nr:hypothetical protein PC113_g20311 [Phytophthora cactorum]KAG2879738.1 hypothetical protein PC114_g22408 [Phytophthora cactorum]KAG2888505.1 hypothetical protein PC115_g20021 [Phytophthora cactorum]KAG2899455.1 hypothetical protein PC117_g22225 [Phytophthora cactorum]KAG3059248.1 hypothetical protein PC122_g20386 [Phytophthora cactorum]